MTDSLSKIVSEMRAFASAHPEICEPHTSTWADRLAALQAGEQQPVAWEGLDENNKPFVYRGEGEPGDKPLVYASPVAQGWQPIREALEYYADPNNYDPDSWNVKAVIREYGDAGKKAREALALLPEQPQGEPPGSRCPVCGDRWSARPAHSSQGCAPAGAAAPATAQRRLTSEERAAMDRALWASVTVVDEGHENASSSIRASVPDEPQPAVREDASFGESELLPCPFCGYAPKVHQTHHLHFVIACDKCGITQQEPSLNDNGAGAIAAWNRRTEKPR